MEVFGQIWGHAGPISEDWAMLGLFWHISETFFAKFWCVLGHSGPILEGFWQFGPLWPISENFWRGLEYFQPFSGFGVIMGLIWRDLGHCEPILANPGAFLEAFKLFWAYFGWFGGHCGSFWHISGGGIILGPFQLFFSLIPVFSAFWHFQHELGLSRPEFSHFWPHIWVFRPFWVHVGLIWGFWGIVGLFQPKSWFSAFWPFQHNFGLSRPKLSHFGPNIRIFIY